MTSTLENLRAPGVPVQVNGLTKRFGKFTAVDDLSFSVEPGRITGFLGPNGSGKTTTLRMLLGLIKPTSGTATIGGRNYVELRQPLRAVGAALEATGFHPGRTGRDHVRILATTAALAHEPVDDLLDFVGLGAVANKRVGEYSLGMRQRLGLAAALVGDPRVLILDEPSNGLDPEGMVWLRGLLRDLAARDKTILVSSHLLAEVQHTVDDVVIIANGRLVKACPIAELGGGRRVLVRTSDTDRLAGALRIADVVATTTEDGALLTDTADLRLVGDVAHRAGLPIWELSARNDDLEQLFLGLTEAPQSAPEAGRHTRADDEGKRSR